MLQQLFRRRIGADPDRLAANAWEYLQDADEELSAGNAARAGVLADMTSAHIALATYLHEYE